MSIELRDYFAAHAAGALVRQGGQPEDIARRAFDLADALCAERRRRADEPEIEALAEELPLWAVEADFERGTLLDEPAPMSERDLDVEPSSIDPASIDPSWEDHADYDPRWEREPMFAAAAIEAAPASDRPSSERPGLKSTRPPGEEKRHRSA